MHSRYVYGVIWADDAGAIDVDVAGVTGANEFTTVDVGPIAAVTSPIDTARPEQTDDDAQAHDDVLRAIVESGVDVVPMGFGMAFEHERALENVLRGGRSAFEGALEGVADRVELGLKVIRGPNAAVDEKAIREAVSDELGSIAASETSNGRFSDRLVCNRSYLVDRDDREAFDRAVARLEEDYDELTFQYTGPFAPYSFVDLKITASGGTP